MWLVFAFLAPALYGVAEILDNFLSNRLFKNPWALALAASLLNICFLPLLFLVEVPTLPPASSIPVFIALGFIEFGYLYPYYKGLQNDDTSIVSALFGLGRVFIPILAFLIVGEILTPVQYAGVILIISSSVLLSFQKHHAKMIFSKSFWYIGLAAFMLSFEGVLLKLLFEQGVNYSTAVGGEMIMALVFALPLFLSKKVRQEVATPWRGVRVLFPILVIEELFTFLAFASETYAIDLAPVTLVKSVTMFIPFFILFYGKLLKARFPAVFKEHLGHLVIYKKVALFLLMVIGIVLVGK